MLEPRRAAGRGRRAQSANGTIGVLEPRRLPAAMGELGADDTLERCSTSPPAAHCRAYEARLDKKYSSHRTPAVIAGSTRDDACGAPPAARGLQDSAR